MSTPILADIAAAAPCVWQPALRMPCHARRRCLGSSCVLHTAKVVVQHLHSRFLLHIHGLIPERLGWGCDPECRMQPVLLRAGCAQQHRPECVAAFSTTLPCRSTATPLRGSALAQYLADVHGSNVCAHLAHMPDAHQFAYRVGRVTDAGSCVLCIAVLGGAARVACTCGYSNAPARPDRFLGGTTRTGAS